MDQFLEQWSKAAHTSLGFFWMALWAFIFGYFLSSMIQVFVTRNRMQKTMGNRDLKSISLGAFFGFISSSCSFSALATTKSLFQKGASFPASIAFLLASTNLVIELGIVISIFLGWQFVVGEYLGGLFLILFSWILIQVIKPKKLIKFSREKLGKKKEDTNNQKSIQTRILTLENWKKVGMNYGMEWKMVWKDVTIGFTIAGIVSAFVPDKFFQTLFINTDNSIDTFSFFTLLQHVIIGPIAAFLTFIGSMGNIPLAALLFGKGVSFAGVIAFIFSDLVVFPVLRINASYYGWKMSLFILFLLSTSLIATSLLLHYSFEWMNILPDSSNHDFSSREHFQINYTFFLNLFFLGLSGYLIYLGFKKKPKSTHHHEMASKSPLLEKVLKYLAFASFIWLIGGMGIWFFAS